MPSSAELGNAKTPAIGGVAIPAVGGGAKKGFSESTKKELMSLLARQTFCQTRTLEEAIGGATFSRTRKLEAVVGGATSSTDQEEDPQAGEKPLKKRRKGCEQYPFPVYYVMIPVPPARPPARSPPPPLDPLAVGSLHDFPGGFWFGIDYPMDIDGPDICGRYFYAKNEVQWSGEQIRLPYLFHGWRPSQHGGKGDPFWTFRDERIQYVTEMVERHEGEYRRRPRLALSVYHSGETEDWRKLQPLAIGSRGPDLHLDHPFITHRRLQLAPSSASGPGSTIVRRTAGQDQPLAASYEARNVFIANLPETFLCSLNTRTVDEVYQEWTSWEVIIGGLAS